MWGVSVQEFEIMTYNIEEKVKTKPSSTDKKSIIKVDAEKLNTFIDAITDCNNNACIHIDGGKLRYISVDIVNVFMLAAELDCDIIIPKGAPETIYVDTSALKRALKLSNGSKVTLECSKSEIVVSYGRFTMTMPSIDPLSVRKDPNPPTIVLPLTIEVPGKYLNDICSMVATSGKIFLYTKDKVVFAAGSEGDMCFKEVIGTIDKKIIARSIFSADYFKKIVKSLKGVSVSLQFGIDYPMIASGIVNDVSLKFLIAPRVESD